LCDILPKTFDLNGFLPFSTLSSFNGGSTPHGGGWLYNLGLRIKEYREAADLTQESFAELVGLGVKHISAMECGSVGVSLSTLKRVSTVLSIPADALLFDSASIFEQADQTAEIQIITSRLSRLPANKFKIVKDIVDKVLEALAM